MQKVIRLIEKKTHIKINRALLGTVYVVVGSLLIVDLIQCINNYMSKF